MKTKNKIREAVLTDRKTITVRFSEVDAMMVVWHGEYIRYFEDGRESFGKHYDGLKYMDIFNSGFLAPMVELNCQYKQSLTFGEEAIIETRYIRTAAAKIMFDYTIYRASDNTVAATGSSVQVFVNAKTRELELNNPPFYADWQKRWIKD